MIEIEEKPCVEAGLPIFTKLIHLTDVTSCKSFGAVNNLLRSNLWIFSQQTKHLSKSVASGQRRMLVG
jgi:hypothetical protein